MSGWVDSFLEQRSSFSGEIRENEPLSRHTYYRIGGPCSVMVIPRSREDLAWIAEGLRHSGARAFILGAGSNLLVSDDGFSGVVIKASRLNLEITALSADRVRLGASVAISTLLRRAAQEGWAGLEFLTGVPGSVGGAVCMNAGTHLGESAGALKRVEAFGLWGENAGREFIFDERALAFEYRRNLFLPAGTIVSATEWAVRGEDPARVKSSIDETLARRKATQPIDYPSCGSVFKNPKGSAEFKNAWQVMERLGLRGHRIGDAQFSEKHCNFIINHGAARASEVKQLIELAKRRALDELGITLEEEVKYLD